MSLQVNEVEFLHLSLCLNVNICDVMLNKEEELSIKLAQKNSRGYENGVSFIFLTLATEGGWQVSFIAL